MPALRRRQTSPPRVPSLRQIMKTNSDPRHQRRIRLLKALYSQQFASTQTPELFPEDREKLSDINARLSEINDLIDRMSVKFASDRMAKIDLSILQLGVYEMMMEKKEPYKVIIDECIELAKEFGGINSPKFVNGILGKIIEEEKHGTGGQA